MSECVCIVTYCCVLIQGVFAVLGGGRQAVWGVLRARNAHSLEQYRAVRHRGNSSRVRRVSIFRFFGLFGHHFYLSFGFSWR